MQRRERRSKAWWSQTVARWRSSGLTASEFAVREQLAASTLRWWSSAIGRDTRATHGSSAIRPIEIAIAAVKGSVEISVGSAVVRCEADADVAFVASLVRAIAER